mmetsp:Transcript_71299/g.127088  ORF Transcript_71299/g.127088 Transcript_71299/m.127088 type:complete len:454 (+) Transcript_71299:31-1392(+)
MPWRRRLLCIPDCLPLPSFDAVKHGTPSSMGQPTSSKQGEPLEVAVEVTMISGITWKFVASASAATRELKTRISALASIPSEEVVLLQGDIILTDMSTPLSKALEGIQVIQLQMLRQRRRAILSGSDDATLRLWSWDAAECVSTLAGHAGEVTCVSVAWFAERALSGSVDKTLKLWNLSNATCTHTLHGHTSQVTCVALEPTALRALSGSADKTLRLWDASCGQCLESSTGHCSQFTCLTAHWDRQLAVTGSRDGSLQIWNLNGMIRLENISAHACPVTCLLADYADSVSILSSSSRSTVVRKCGKGVPDTRLDLQAGGDASTCTTLDSKMSVACTGSIDGVVRAWNLQSGAVMKMVPRPNTWIQGGGALGEELWNTAPPCPLSCLAVNWEGQEALSGSADGMLNVIDLVTSSSLGVLTGHTARVTCLEVDWQTPSSRPRTFLQAWDALQPWP